VCVLTKVFVFPLLGKGERKKKENKYEMNFLVFIMFFFYVLCMAFFDPFGVLGFDFSLILVKLESMLLLRSFRLLFSRLLGWEVPLFILDCIVGSVVGSSLHMMDPAGWEDGSSSRVPQSEPSVNHAPDPAEPVAPDPDVYHPLLDDNTRRAELDERAGFHFAELSDQNKNSILDSQVIIERAIEKALLSDGYSRDELNELSKRNEIRGFLFYPQGKLLSLRKYKKYVEEVSFGTHRSKPYKDLIYAISASKLFLKKVKPLKKWELRRVF